MGCSASCREPRPCAGGLAPDVLAVLRELYPTRRWGEPDDRARFGAGIPAAEGRRLGARLARALGTRVWFRPGRDDECCDYLYALCVGRDPGLLAVGGDVSVLAPLADEGPDAYPRSDVYLRAALSAMARLATFQEVLVSLERDGETLVVREEPRAGVREPLLLPRLGRAIDVLEAARVRHVPYRQLALAPEGFDPGDYATRYGGVPGAVSYLFTPEPTTLVTNVYPCAEPASSAS